MGTFSKISATAFNELQTDAGVLLKSFDPTKPALVASDIICATTGGINPSCVPTYTDLFEDIDNAPKNTKDGLHLDGWDCTLGFTALSITADTIKLALGAATDTDGKITPKANLSDTDFTDIWWVGDLSNGGCVAVCLKNAISTGGFSLQTTKNGKGRLSVTLKGFVSAAAQTDIPMEFYVLPAPTTGGSGGTT